MIIELGKHKGMPISQLLDHELFEMFDKMLPYYQKKGFKNMDAYDKELFAAVGAEVSKRKNANRPKSVREATFKLESQFTLGD